MQGGTVTITTVATGSMQVDASAVTGPGHRLNIATGEANDTILGGAGDDSISVGNGSNVVISGGGADTVGTGNGLDRIDLGAGDDLLLVDAINITTADTLDGGTGLDTLRLGAGLFSYHSTSFTNFRGIERFELTSNEAHNLTFLNAYYDSAGFTGSTITVISTSTVGVTLSATGVSLFNGRTLEATLGGGNDSVWGTANNDTISAGDGTDFVRGMNGADVLTGGSGNDVFAFYSWTESSSGTVDVITDYTVGEDRIDISGMTASLTYIGTGPFTGIGGQVRWQNSGGNTYVYVDTNGDYIQDFILQLNGTKTLTSADFLGLTSAPNFILTGVADNFVGGAGADIFETGSSSLQAADTLTGGAGMDTFRITSNSGHNITFASLPNLTGIEQFVIRNNVSHTFVITDAYFATAGFDGSVLTIDSTSPGNITVTANTLTSGHDLRITSGEGNDNITLGGGDDSISSGGGNDRVFIYGGSDSVDLGSGQDTLDLNTGDLDATDTVYGGGGIDLLRVNSGVLVFDTGTQILRGFEQIQLNTNAAHRLTFTDAFFTDSGFSGGMLTVSTSSSTAVLVDMGAVSVTATASISGSSAADTLIGGAGADTFLANNGADTITGNAGADIFRYTATAHSTNAASDVITDFVSGTDKLDFTGLNFTYIDTDAFSGGGAAGQLRWTVSGSDVLVQVDTDGNATADMTIRLLNTSSLTYADFIGLGGYFQLTSGNDSFAGGALVDMFVSTATNISPDDSIMGGAGNDIFRIGSGAGATAIDMNTHTNISGIDIFQLYTSAAHVFTLNDDYYTRGGLNNPLVTVNVSSSIGVVVDASQVANVANMLSSTGSSGADTLLGGAGADTLNGSSGNNSLDGGGGNDFIYVNSGTEWISGGGGNDTAYVVAGTLAAADTLLGGADIDTFRFASGVLTLDTAALPNLAGFERFELASTGAHVLTFDNTYFARAGFDGNTVTIVNQVNNAITVNASAVTNSAVSFHMTGQNGAETFIGGAGADTIIGANGADSLTGGGGADRFVFTPGTSAVATPDVITDFVSGTDILDISNGTQQLWWIGNTAFGNIAGQVRWQTSGSDIILQVDWDGNSTADLAIRLANTATLNAYDLAGLGIQYTLTAGVDTMTGTATNDLFVGTSATIGASDTAAGGAGTDVFRINGTSGATLNATTWTAFSGFETITIGTTANVNNTITIDDAYFARAGFEGAVLTVNYASGTDGGLIFNGSGITNPAYALLITSSSRADTIIGGAGADTINGNSNDSIRGGDGNDYITSYRELYGDAGDDTITATSTSTIDGGTGNDLIYGSTSQDVISGGVGADTIYTGASNDVVVYTSVTESNAANPDIIMDFAPGLDVVRVVGMGFTGIQAGAASGSVLGYSFDGTYTNVTNAAGTFLVRFLGNHSLNNSNFQFTANVFNGSNGDDSIFGTIQNETINGLGGNDTLYGGGGTDTINGGTGNDYIVSTSWQGVYNGDDGDDTIAGGRVMNGGNGNDSIIGHLTNTDFITGGDGADTIETRGTITTRDGNNGGDVIYYTAISESSTAAPDIILDFLQGSDVISLVGLGFTDIQSGAPAGSVLGYSFDGTYTNITNAAGTFLLRLLGNQSPTSASFIFTAGVINGTSAGESIIGTSSGETIYAGDGDDTVHAGWGGGRTDLGNGNDSFWGGYGTINGGDGDDTFTPQDWSSIDGGAGVDSIVGYAGTWDTIIGGAGADLIWGGSNAGDAYRWTALTESTTTETDIIHDYTAGDLFVLYGLGFTGIQAGAASGTTLGYVFDGTYTVVSSTGSFMFKLLGNTVLSSANFMFTSGVINGTGGNDLIYGTGSAGFMVNDTIDGGLGNDTIFGGGYNDSIRGGDGNDVISAVGSIDGGLGNDTITSTGWNNWAMTVDGGDGNDSITSAGNGADSLFGGNGNDIISGLTGADTINGGAGRDTLTGGNDADRFQFSSVTHSTIAAPDLITDFQNGTDRFVLTGLGFTSITDFESITFSGGVTTIVDTQTSFSFQISGNVVSQLDNTDFVF